MKRILQQSTKIQQTTSTTCKKKPKNSALFSGFVVVAITTILLIVTGASLAADVGASADSFNYLSFSKLAVQELKFEKQFLEDIYDKGGAASDDYFGLLFGKSQTTRANIKNQLDGLVGILACVDQGTPEKVKSAMDEIINAPPSTPDGSTGFLDCAETAGLLEKHAAAALAHNSAYPVADMASAPAPHMFNPVLAALIQAYKSKAAISNPLFEEKVSNTILFAARSRTTIDEAILDFARLKYRFGASAEFSDYFKESMLSDADRLGISVLTQCLKDEAPMGAISSYAIRGEIPPDSFLQGLACLNGGKSLDVVALKKNFAAMGLAIMGRNAFLYRDHEPIPSLVYEAIKSKTPADRQKAKERIYEINDFVNKHLYNLRRGVAGYHSFKGLSGWKLEKKFVLVDVLLNEYRKDHADELSLIRQDKTVSKVLTAVSDGALSCAIGQVKALPTFIGIGIAIGIASNSPNPIIKGGAWVVSSGLALKGAKDASEELAELLDTYQRVPFTQTVEKACNAVINTIGAVQGIYHPIRSTMQFGATVKGKKPSEPQAAKPKGSTEFTAADADVQPATHVRDKANELGNTAAENPRQAQEDWNQQFTSQEPPGTRTAKYESQKVLESQKVDLAGALIEKAKKELGDLKKKTQSENSQEAASARAALETKSKEYAEKLFDATVSDPRVLLVETPSGYRLLYVPEKPGEIAIPIKIQEKIRKLNAALEEAGIDAHAKIQTTPDGIQIVTARDYAESLAGYMKRFLECRKAKLAPLNEYAFESKDAPVRGYSQRVLLFDQTASCPRLDQIMTELRNVLFPKNVRGGVNSKAQLSKVQKEAVEKFRASLDFAEGIMFDVIYEKMNRPKTFKDFIIGLFKKSQPLSVTAVLDYVKSTVRMDGYTASKDLVDFKIKLALALDPELPPSLDPFGRHKSLFDVAVNPISEDVRFYQKKSKDYAASKEKAKAEEFEDLANDRMRTYDEDVVNELTKLDTPLSDSEFSFIFDRYDFADPGAVAFFKKVNREWPGLADKAARVTSGGTVTTAGSRNPVVKNFQEIGAGSFQTAVLVSIGQIDSSTGFINYGKFIDKIGKSNPKQSEFYQQEFYRNAVKSGFFPEVFGVIRHGERSLVIQGYVEGKPFSKVVNNKASITVINSAAEAFADTDAGLFKLSSKKVGKDGLEGELNTDVTLDNVIWETKSGKAVVIDYDVQATTRQRLEDALTFLFVIRFRELGSEGFFSYVHRLRKNYYEDNKGPAFDRALKDARSFFSDPVKYRKSIKRLSTRFKADGKQILTKSYVFDDLGIIYFEGTTGNRRKVNKAKYAQEILSILNLQANASP